MSKTYKERLERELRDHQQRVEILHKRWVEACKERNALTARVERLEAVIRTEAHAGERCVVGPHSGEPHDWTIPQYGRIACCARCGVNKSA